MKVVLQDLTHAKNPRNEQVIDRPHVMELLNASRQVRPPTMYQLVGDNGFTLTVGIDGDFGCIQHAATDGVPPYLMVTDPANVEPSEREMEFVVGGTATPIDGRYRIPFSLLKNVVDEFVESGNRSAFANWEEF